MLHIYLVLESNWFHLVNRNKVLAKSWYRGTCLFTLHFLWVQSSAKFDAKFFAIFWGQYQIIKLNSYQLNGQKFTYQFSSSSSTTDVTLAYSRAVLWKNKTQKAWSLKKIDLQPRGWKRYVLYPRDYYRNSEAEQLKAQYIYQDSKFLSPVVCFAELV